MNDDDRDLFGKGPDDPSGKDNLSKRDLSYPHGAISDETERRLDRAHQSVSPRYSELRALGLIDYLYVNSVRMRRNTRDGNLAYVHIATEQGKAAAKLGIPIRGVGRDITSGRHGGDAMSENAYEKNKVNLSMLRLLVLQDIAAFS